MKSKLVIPADASPKQALLLRLEQLKFQARASGCRLELGDAQLVIREFFADDLTHIKD